MASKKDSLIKSLLVATIVAVGAGVFLWFTSDKTEDTGKALTENSSQQDADSTETTTSQFDPTTDLDYSGQLLDVTNGQTIRGVTIDDESTSAMAYFGEYDGGFRMYAQFTGLPDPQGDDFYEGWLVAGNGDFISTGKLVKNTEGSTSWVDEFTSETDYTSYNKYVLTIEPNDDDPAPADHILEGTLTK